MKKIKILFAASQVVIALLLYCFFPAGPATFIFLACLFVCGLCFGHYLHTQKLRARWLKMHLSPDTPEFDDFFWQLSPSNQDWYADVVLKKEGVNNLIARYDRELAAVWQDNTLSLQEKIDETAVYSGYLQALSHIREFNGAFSNSVNEAL